MGQSIDYYNIIALIILRLFDNLMSNLKISKNDTIFKRHTKAVESQYVSYTILYCSASGGNLLGHEAALSIRYILAVYAGWLLLIG